MQFRTVSLPEWRDAVVQAGARILGYFPHNAHLVKMPAGLRPRVEALEFVERVEPFHPSYRMEQALRGWSAGSS